MKEKPPGAVDTLCQWHPHADDFCENVATKWFVNLEGSLMLAVCERCESDFLLYNQSHFREVPREEAEVFEVVAS